MKRMFGMMPVDEIEKEERYEDTIGLKITIQAGPNGWSILYADSSSEWKDCVSTTEDNFNDAYKVATRRLGEVKKLYVAAYDVYREICGEC